MHLTFKATAGLIALAVLAGPAAQAQNLVQNGGFETGNFLSWTVADSIGNTTVRASDPTGFEGPSHSGSFFAGFGNNSNTDGSISQELTTTSGQAYTISFYLDNNSAAAGYDATPNDFSATFGSTTLQFQSDIAPETYQKYSYIVTAQSAQTLLTFAGYDNPYHLGLDDVSVTPGAVPEASTTVSFGLLLALGMGGIVIASKKKTKAAKASGAA